MYRALESQLYPLHHTAPVQMVREDKIFRSATFEPAPLRADRAIVRYQIGTSASYATKERPRPQPPSASSCKAGMRLSSCSQLSIACDDACASPQFRNVVGVRRDPRFRIARRFCTAC